MHRQRGFAMLELAVAVLVATLLVVWGASSLVHKINDAAAQASAVWMLAIKKGAQGYLERHATLLVSAPDASALSGLGYANWARPSLAELKADQLLSPGFPEQGAAGQGAAVIVMRSGVCPGADCRLEALIYATKAFAHTPSGAVDEQMVAQWLMASQGWGGSVKASSPHEISGAAFVFPNPPAPGIDRLPQGTVAMAVTSEQLGALDFLRVRDLRDPQFQGDASVKGDIHAQASLRVKKQLFVEAESYFMTSCTADGAIVSDPDGGLLMCHGKRWRSAGRRSAGGYMINSKRGCWDVSGKSTANPITGACSCPVGAREQGVSDSGPDTEAQGRTWGYICIE